MTNRLKSVAQFLSKKYSWHTLGETNNSTTSRGLISASKRDALTSDPVRSVFVDVPTPVAKKVKTTTKSIGQKRVAIPPLTQSTGTAIIKFKPNTKSKTLLAKREALTMEIYQEYNEVAFDSMLPSDMSITWSKRLTSTAGITKMSSTSRGAKKIAEIVLSEKVLDDSVRLRATLLHEMCHSAAWLIDGERKPPHGACFWKWASICGASLPGMLVSTCHSYAIHTPYRFQCVGCKHQYGRHSKRGVDLDRHCCGVCKGKLEFMGVFNSDGTRKTPRKMDVLS